MSVGIAIIGSGIFVKEEHLPAALSCSQIELKAIYSRSFKSAQTLATGSALDAEQVSLYSEDGGPGHGYSDLLRRDDIHGVIIALPITSQPKFIKEALSAGKHVLSEKPIAQDMQHAQELIDFYALLSSKVTWSVAENFRFYDSYAFARTEIAKLGRILNFTVKVFSLVKGGKYFETEWRRNPQYQGGFLLDAGVHFTSAVRTMLGPSTKPTALSAYTTLLRQNLAPADTINSIWKTETGISGTMSISFGTSLSGSEYTVACEEGSVTVIRDKVTVRKGQQSFPVETGTVSEFPGDNNAVKKEVAAWAESIISGKQHPAQTPQQALADLEILEAMLTSGNHDGGIEKLLHQL